MNCNVPKPTFELKHSGVFFPFYLNGFEPAFQVVQYDWPRTYHAQFKTHLTPNNFDDDQPNFWNSAVHVTLIRNPISAAISSLKYNFAKAVSDTYLKRVYNNFNDCLLFIAGQTKN